MKVFISHKDIDAPVAKRIADRLRIYHNIPSYLDSIDPHLYSRGEDLAEYLRSRLDDCTQLLAVVSEGTKASQWVPWEIGVATEKDYPLATFSDGTPPPEFLTKWPYLRTEAQLDAYAEASKAAQRVFVGAAQSSTVAVSRGRATKAFYQDLRRRLNQ